MRVLLIALFAVSSWAQLSHQEYLQATRLVEEAYTNYRTTEGFQVKVLDYYKKYGFATFTNHGRKVRVLMSGEWAKREGMTVDSFVLMLCHELGHGISSAPSSYRDPKTGLGSSYEGQAEYYARDRKSVV